MRRRQLNRRKSEKMFTRGASRVHKKNLMSSSGSGFVMRGGIRL